MMTKPLGRKNYGSIPHLPGSRVGPGDHTCHEGQARIATVKTRDRHDEVLVQEKLDGSNVGVALVGGKLYALTRRGWLAEQSRFAMHRCFALWVEANHTRFFAVLQEGERLVGEWLMQAHGTIYNLQHEPFVAFDLMTGSTRTPYDEFLSRIAPGDFVTPALLYRGGAFSIKDSLDVLGDHGYHGAVDLAEGCVWRIEREDPHRGRYVDFLVKFVRPTKVDGRYLSQDIFLAVPPSCQNKLV